MLDRYFITRVFLKIFRSSFLTAGLCVVICAFYLLVVCLLFFYSHLGITGWQESISFSISPDEKYILYSRDDKINCFDIEKGTSTILTFSDKSDAFPSFSPDGTHIIFTRGNSFGANLWIMRTDGTDQRQINNTKLALDFGAVFSPSGNKIAFFRKYYGNDHSLFVIEFSSGKILMNKKISSHFPQRIFWQNETSLYYTSWDLLHHVDLISGIITDLKLRDVCSISFTCM
jgi:WD40 repeat protein